MTFRFRAGAALDIRRAQEDTARRRVADAEMAVQQAASDAREAAARAETDARRLVDLQQGGAESWRLQWHRAWLERQRRDVAGCAQAVTRRQVDLAKATIAATEAMQRRKVLERLRDRAWRRHQRHERDRHNADMNELATLRFVAQITNEGGTRAD